MTHRAIPAVGQAEGVAEFMDGLLGDPFEIQFPVGIQAVEFRRKRKRETMAPLPDTWASPTRYFMTGINRSTGVIPRILRASRGAAFRIFFIRPVEKYWSRWAS